MRTDLHQKGLAESQVSQAEEEPHSHKVAYVRRRGPAVFGQHSARGGPC
jgi:hypothetical protein